ncbi:hypothetical protein [Mesobacillus foraminis]|uniref:hypothetical protein n=1 Tax=Mesobacillus foraminis TaxID=279826 RepID=UPI00288B1FCC|nr:hypothetical protein [Mesobacillus foraminis]
MFVAEGAKDLILTKRKNQTLKVLVRELILESARLQMTKSELIELIMNTKEEEDQ